MRFTATAMPVPALIRRFREELNLTQAELARRVGTTQSVISRLENDEYEGHSLSMLYRIATAVNRRIAVTVVDDGSGPHVRERAPGYRGDTRDAPDGLSEAELRRLTHHLVEQFGGAGLSRSAIDTAIGLARADTLARAVGDLRGAIKVGPGNVVEDVRDARQRRGRERASP